MSNTKTLTATIVRLERSTATLDLDGKEVAFPRAALPTPINEGDGLTLVLVRDATVSTRAEVEEDVDLHTGRRLGARKRGNPRGASARANKK
jgi:hypothetical protein